MASMYSVLARPWIYRGLVSRGPALRGLCTQGPNTPPQDTPPQDTKAQDTKAQDTKAQEDKAQDTPDTAIETKAQENKTQAETPAEVKSAEVVGEGVSDPRAAARQKLNALLSSLATADRIPVEPVADLELAKPKPRLRKAKKQEEPQPEEPEPGIEPELVAATKDVAQTLGGDVAATESELLSTLRSHSTDHSKSPANLSELFVGLKVERSQARAVVERPRRKRYDQTLDPAQSVTQAPRDFSKPRGPLTREYVATDLFGSKPLGIFQSGGGAEGAEGVAAVESHCASWDATHGRELAKMTSQPPSNALVEMIQWTRQGKMWPLPIDNEMGLEEEKQVGFHEHVFLERHLEGWCPARGPVRHFMELVCTGLSKNPYLTVARKKAHIEWYKNYFAEKEDLLREIGAIEAKQ